MLYLSLLHLEHVSFNSVFLVHSLNYETKETLGILMAVALHQIVFSLIFGWEDLS